MWLENYRNMVWVWTWGFDIKWELQDLSLFPHNKQPYNQGKKTRYDYRTQNKQYKIIDFAAFPCDIWADTKETEKKNEKHQNLIRELRSVSKTKTTTIYVIAQHPKGYLEDWKKLKLKLALGTYRELPFCILQES